MRILPLGSSALKIGTTGAGMTPDQVPTVARVADGRGRRV